MKIDVNMIFDCWSIRIGTYKYTMQILQMYNSKIFVLSSNIKQMIFWNCNDGMLSTFPNEHFTFSAWMQGIVVMFTCLAVRQYEQYEQISFPSWNKEKNYS